MATKQILAVFIKKKSLTIDRVKIYKRAGPTFLFKNDENRRKTRMKRFMISKATIMYKIEKLQ